MEIEAQKAKIFIGRNSGALLCKNICDAKHSIQVLSPYVSLEYVELLLNAQKRGVAVSLFAESDMASNTQREEIYQRVLVQHRSVNGKVQVAKYIGMLLCIALTACLTFFVYWGYKKGFIPSFQEIRSAGPNMTIMIGLAILFFLAVCIMRWFLILVRMRIYQYRYTPKFDLVIFASPYDKKNSAKKQTEPFFVHSKIYVIDHRLAFVGSLNFTEKGFQDNYECCVKISDPDAVLRIAGELERLREVAPCCDLNQIGSSVFAEPPN